ncbi:MAG: MvaI/BcnI restriction endonuclease family protein [Leptospira sp.]|nr:MvaI/BcnI restriction endonuclease family protein [Leptospira sp.]
MAKCQNPPSELMTQRLADRLLFVSVAKSGMVLGFVTAPDSELANEFYSTKFVSEHGVFKVIELPQAANNKEKLISELLRIHRLGWIKSKRLDGKKRILPCESSNCGGYTLEAELGITPNGYSEPDFMGWEIKQFGVKSFLKVNSAVITLMTPEPTDGLYKSDGVEAFLRKYGYVDKTGREDRINFGGIHKMGIRNRSTNLEMQLIGFDTDSGKIRNTNGRVVLLDVKGNETAAWSFASLLLHWTKKHNQACYVPSIPNIDVDKNRQYKYGNNIILGVGTDFQLFLEQMSIGNIYYDPGIKMENASTNPTVKRRSQFRIKSQYIVNLYKTNEIIDITK